ncbi:MAG TPA: phosphate ABC transporter permease PstA [Acidimicrobiia bacterium]
MSDRAVALHAVAASAPAVAPVQRPRPRVGFDASSWQDLVGALVAGVSGAALLLVFAPLGITFGKLSGGIGVAIIAYLIFVVVYGAVTWLRSDGVGVANALFTVLSTSAAVLVVTALVSIVGWTLWKGHAALVHSNFYTQDMAKAGPNSNLKVGGMAHALVGTVWMISIALVISAPLGLVTAVYLSETKSRFSRMVRTLVDAMTALPTILAGLFIYAFWILELGNEQSGLAAALALSIMMLPYIVRSADLVLRLVPGNLREASAALGAPRWRTTRTVVLPTARSGLATSVILGIARGIGEASPVLLTAGFSTFMNTNPTKGPMVSLPILALNLIGSPNNNLKARGFATAAFLLLVVLVLFVSARLIAGRSAGEVSPRKRSQLMRASARDAQRIADSQQMATAVAAEATP